MIPNINELEDALCKAGGTTANQVETAKINIPCHKGRKKTSEYLLRELTVLIKEEEKKGQTERESF